MSEFKVGDKVRAECIAYRGIVTITFGPYTSVCGDPAYLVTDEDGLSRPLVASLLKHIPPADPRQQVVTTAVMGWAWDVSADYADELASAILAALDAMKPAESKRYMDSEGGTWEAQSDGTLSMRSSVDPSRLARNEELRNQRFERVESDYGPLTPLNS